MGIGQSEPGMRMGEIQLCPGRWERALCGAEGMLVQEGEKTGNTGPLRGPTVGYGRSAWDLF
jgi:hypothetical protein